MLSMPKLDYHKLKISTGIVTLPRICVSFYNYGSDCIVHPAGCLNKIYEGREKADILALYNA